MAKADWNAIRAEYVGGASFGELAKKYHLSKSTIFAHAKADEWQTLRTNASNAARTKTVQKVAEAAASNADLFEQVRALALKRVKKALEQMPETGGSHIRQYAQQGGKRITVDYDLLELVTALDKLERSSSSDQADEKQDDGFLEALSGTAAEDWADEG